MEHQQEDTPVNIKGLYYLVGLLTGLFTGLVTAGTIGWIIALGVVGLLFAALFQQVFVRGREQR